MRHPKLAGGRVLRSSQTRGNKSDGSDQEELRSTGDRVSWGLEELILLRTAA